MLPRCWSFCCDYHDSASFRQIFGPSFSASPSLDCTQRRPASFSSLCEDIYVSLPLCPPPTSRIIIDYDRPHSKGLVSCYVPAPSRREEWGWMPVDRSRSLSSISGTSLDATMVSARFLGHLCAFIFLARYFCAPLPAIRMPADHDRLSDVPRDFRVIFLQVYDFLVTSAHAPAPRCTWMPVDHDWSPHAITYGRVHHIPLR